MRRHTLILVLVAILGIPVAAGAQAFPPELDGDQAGGVFRELKFAPTEHFQLPWSIPAPDPDTRWLTDISVGIMHPFPILVEQECLMDENNDCWLPPVTPFQEYPWDGGIGSYCLTDGVSDGSGDMIIDCYTWDFHNWKHYTGLLEFTGHPPQWYDWGWYILDIAAEQGLREAPHDKSAISVTE